LIVTGLYTGPLGRRPKYLLATVNIGLYRDNNKTVKKLVTVETSEEFRKINVHDRASKL